MGRMQCLMEKKISCYKSFGLLWFLLQFQFFCCVFYLFHFCFIFSLVFCSTFSNPLSLNVFIFLRCGSLWASIPYPQPIFLLCIPHISKVHWLKWMILTVCCNRLAAKVNYGIQSFGSARHRKHSSSHLALSLLLNLSCSCDNYGLLKVD